VDQNPHYFWKLDPDPHEVKIQRLYRLKIELWRAVDAHNGDGGLEAQKKSLWLQMPITFDEE
jgi:hypothetical protein